MFTSRSHRRVTSLNLNKSNRRQRRFESLEARQMMHGDALDELGSAFDIDSVITADFVVTATPINTVPALSSRPGAAATLYLDFDGHFQSSFYGCDDTLIGDICGGGYDDITTPVFDRNGDPTTFSDSEVDAMRQIWTQVAEDYAPFNINVTTVDPGDFSSSSHNMRIAIGGQNFTSASASGVSYVHSFTDSAPNIAYAFAQRADGTNYSVRKVGEVVSHEAGHAFGLYHQSTYNSTLVKTEEYNSGDAQRAPIMGESSGATRGTWVRGPSSISSSFFLSPGDGQYLITNGFRYVLGQDDMARIARSANGFGYRPDDHFASYLFATPLSIGTGKMTASGVIEQTTDKDAFKFFTGGGQVTVNVNTARFTSAVSGTTTLVGNLDARVELRNASGTLIASAAPSTSLDAQLTANLAAGNYYIVVGSNGAYGDVGQYTVDVTENRGPRVISISSVPVDSTLDGYWVTFDEPINASSFTPADVAVSAGRTSLPVASVVPVFDGDGRTFLISYAKSSFIAGTSISIGPQVTDYFGNAMNQDGDAINGEVIEDKFVSTSFLATGLLAGASEDRGATAPARLRKAANTHVSGQHAAATDAVFFSLGFHRSKR